MRLKLCARHANYTHIQRIRVARINEAMQSIQQHWIASTDSWFERNWENIKLKKIATHYEYDNELFH